jgi:hypothetical protein
MNYRIRITDSQGNRTYLVRKNGNVSFISASETPLALNNLIQRDAAAARFQLEDATDGTAAAKALRTILADQWANNKPLTPKVELLTDSPRL